jgi:nucleotide-binding universal stress UspA family protein
MMQRVLIAYDGSPSAERAFRFALGLVKPFAADVVLLSVVQPPEPAEMVETSAWLDAANEHYARDFAKLQEAARAAGITLTTKVATGHPAEQIIHEAAEQKADLIVMGHRGKSVFQRWLLGSVSKRVLSYSPCAVLIVR